MIILTVVAISIVIFHIVQNQDGIVASILEIPVLKFLGTISYGLYIVHYPIAIIGVDYYQALLVELGYAPSAATEIVFFILVFASSVGLAAASWYGMEKRFIARKKSVARSAPAAGQHAIAN